MAKAIPAWTWIGLAAVAGCDASLNLAPADSAPPPYPSRDAGTIPTSSSLIAENFDNRDLIASVESPAIVDTSSGRALVPPPYRLPELPTSLDTVTFGDTQNIPAKRVEGKNVHLGPNAAVNATDALELAAGEEIRIAGRVSAGEGGVTLVAGRRIVIEPYGHIESRGPISLYLSDPAGEIEIAGQIIARAFVEDDDEPRIDIVSRGRITINGVVAGIVDSGRMGGAVTVVAYEDVVIAGGVVATTSNARGTPGTVRLTSYKTLRVQDGAAVGPGGPMQIYPLTTGGPGGDLTLEGNDIEISGAQVWSGRAVSANGHHVQLASPGTIRLFPGASVRAGEGATGGTLTVRAREVQLDADATLESGVGDSSGGALQVFALAEVRLIEGGAILGGSARCGTGAAVRIEAARVRGSPRARIEGGGGAEHNGTTCISNTRVGGSVEIVTGQLTGFEQDQIRGGAGDPPGPVSLRVEPDYPFEAPSFASSAGSITSVVFDRGVKSRGLSPTLRDIDAEAPGGSNVRVLLAGAHAPDAPFVDWYDVQDPSALQPLAEFRYFRYRVELFGRPFDEPFVNYFEIELGD